MDLNCILKYMTIAYHAFYEFYTIKQLRNLVININVKIEIGMKVFYRIHLLLFFLSYGRSFNLQ